MNDKNYLAIYPGEGFWRRNPTVSKEDIEEVKKTIRGNMLVWELSSEANITDAEFEIAYQVAQDYLTPYPLCYDSYRPGQKIQPNIPYSDDIMTAVEMIRDKKVKVDWDNMTYELTPDGICAVLLGKILEEITGIYGENFFYSDFGAALFSGALGIRIMDIMKDPNNTKSFGEVIHEEFTKFKSTMKPKGLKTP